MSDTTTNSETDETPNFGVNLFMRRQAESPEDAVQTFMQDTLHTGLANYTFTVKDLESGDLYFVEAGETYTEEEFGARLEAEAAEQGGD